MTFLFFIQWSVYWETNVFDNAYLEYMFWIWVKWFMHRSNVFTEVLLEQLIKIQHALNVKVHQMSRMLY